MFNDDERTKFIYFSFVTVSVHCLIDRSDYTFDPWENRLKSKMYKNIYLLFCNKIRSLKFENTIHLILCLIVEVIFR